MKRRSLTILWAAYVGAVWATAAAIGHVGRGVDHGGERTTIDRLASWDGSHYATIARTGYSTIGAEVRHTAFFPLFPAVARGLGGRRYFILAGLALNQALLLGSLLLLTLIVPSPRGRTLVTAPAFWFLISPLAFLCAAFYAESLFLFLTIAAYVAFTRGRSEVAGAAALLAGLTRPTAVGLSALFLVEAVLARRAGRRVAPALMCAAAPVAGAVGFMLWVGIQTGHVGGYLPIQAQFWQQRWTLPFALDLSDIQATAHAMVHGHARTAAENFRLGWTAINLSLLAWGWRRLPPSLVAYLVGSLLFIHMQSPNISTARREFFVFPTFLLIAAFIESVPARGRTMFALLCAVVSLLLQARFLLAFLTFRWVA